MPSASKDLSGPGAGLALAILTLVNLSNYLDRYVLAALVESVRQTSLCPMRSSVSG